MISPSSVRDSQRPPRSGAVRPFFLYLLAFAVYFLIACIVTWPLAAQLNTHIAGFMYGDGREMVHHLWWFRFALERGQPLFTQTWLGYPNGIDGITLWANPLQFVPGWLLTFTLSPVAAYNLPLLLNMAGNGTAMMLLMRRLLSAPQSAATYKSSGRPHRVSPAQSVSSSIPHPPPAINRVSPTPNPQSLIPALLSGVIFMLYPVMLGHLGAGHSGLMVQWPLPLYVLALLRARERGTSRRRQIGALLLIAVLFVVGAWGHTLQAIYALLPITAVFVLWAWFGRERRAALLMLAGVGVGAVLLALYLLPVWRSTLGTAAYTDAGGAVRYSADLLAIVTPSFRHPLWGEVLSYPARVLGVNIDEGAAYIGILPALLALVAFVRVKAARVWLALGVLAYGLALGPVLKVFDQPVQFETDGYQSLVTLPFAGLMQLPGLNLARSPGRFNFALALAVAVAAGYGLWGVGNWLAARKSQRWLLPVATVASALIAFDTLTFWPLPTTEAAIPPQIAGLGDLEGVRAVLDVPWDNLITAKDGLYLQTAHGLPLIAGQVTRSTPVNPAMLDMLQTLDPPLLQVAGADVVIVHRDEADDALEAHARERLGTPLYEDGRYAVYRTPDVPLTDEWRFYLPGYIGTAPSLFDFLSTDFQLASDDNTSLYTPERSWLRLEGVSRSINGERTGVFRWNSEIVRRVVGRSEDAEEYRLALPTDARSFNRLVLQTVPPCPSTQVTGVLCERLTVRFSDGDVIQETGDSFPGATYEGGIALPRAYAAVRTYTPGGSHRLSELSTVFDIYLYWRFTQPRNDQEVRFVHVLNAAGELVAQSDVTPGAVNAGEAYGEVVSLDATTLPAGEYRVYAGWYAYPDLARFCLLADGNTCSADTSAFVGTVTMAETP